MRKEREEEKEGGEGEGGGGRREGREHTSTKLEQQCRCFFVFETLIKEQGQSERGV